MYGEGYPVCEAVEVKHVSDGAYVWYDPEGYGLGHERYGEQPPAKTRNAQTVQGEVIDEVQ